MVNDAEQSKPQWDDKPPQASYSLDEAAAFLEVRADDLAATLPAAGIDLSTRKEGRLTREDVERLERTVHSVRQIPSQSEYGGGNL